jgi:hypothetical protein
MTRFLLVCVVVQMIVIELKGYFIDSKLMNALEIVFSILDAIKYKIFFLFAS